MFTEEIILSLFQQYSNLFFPMIINHGLAVHVCCCVLFSGRPRQICQVLHGRGSYSPLPSEHSLIKDQSGLESVTSELGISSHSKS